MDRSWAVKNESLEFPWEGTRFDQVTCLKAKPGFQESSDQIQLFTSELTVEIDLKQFAIRFRAADSNEVFLSDLTPSPYLFDQHSQEFFHYCKRSQSELFAGLGEKSGRLFKNQRRLRMKSVDAMGYDAEFSDPLYKHWPFFLGILPEKNITYGVFYDNPAECLFDFGQEIHAYHEPYRYYQAQDGDLDCYVIFGPKIQKVLSSFLDLTGTTAPLSEQYLGYLGSTMSYTEALNSQEKLMEFLEKLNEHNLKCDLFHLSSGYTSNSENKRYVFQWNNSKFPKPSEIFSRFQRKGISVSANVKPFLLKDHPEYESLQEAKAFVQSKTNESASENLFWGGTGSLLDFTNPHCIAWWKEKCKESLFSQQITSLWNDNNEYNTLDKDEYCHGFGQELPLQLVRPIQSLLMNRASFEAQSEFFDDPMPYLLTRSGYPGVQRYAQTWSGDNFTSWKTLKFNLWMGIGMSLSGLYNFGHDVGGFAGPKPEPELFLRWIEMGVFLPRFCVHSWNSDASVNELWMYPEQMPTIKKWLHFREKLRPYLKLLFERASQYNEPLIRPTFYDFGEQDPQTFEECLEFMLGPQLLVAPVVEKSQTVRRLYLPQGPQQWVELNSKQEFESGQHIEVKAELEDCPIFYSKSLGKPTGL